VSGKPKKTEMTYLAFFILVFTGIRLLVVLANFLGMQWLRHSRSSSEPLISVLIPARNEEENIGILLSSLIEHDYSNIKIWVYDDLSTDKTAFIVQQLAAKDSRIHLLSGRQLPHGWIGKNHGCHQLAHHADGEYLLYLDADVIIQKGLIKNAVANMQKYHLDLFSIFPAQRMGSLAEWLTVPVMNWILVSLLPLVLVRLSSHSSFSAANGQFMMFRADVYRRELFHKTLKHANVEDIAISRLMKRKGYKVQTLLGNKQIQCRMYKSWDDAVKGFSRNVFYFFGGSKIAGFLFGFITTFGFIPVFLYLPLSYFIVYGTMVALIRILISISSRQNVLFNLLLAPLQQLSFLYILTSSAVLRYRRATTWKGRIID
jgi:glycosyltransferase involved in cell wall biosynthesis